MKEISRRIYYILLTGEGSLFAAFLLLRGTASGAAGTSPSQTGIFHYLVISMAFLLALGSVILLLRGLLKPQAVDLVGEVFLRESYFIPLSVQLVDQRQQLCAQTNEKEGCQECLKEICSKILPVQD